MQSDQKAMEKPTGLRFSDKAKPIVAIFHDRGPLDIAFAQKFLDTCVNKWFEDIRRYGDLISVSSPAVTIFAREPDGQVIWQLTIGGLVRDVTENIPGELQRIIDVVSASGGTVRMDNSGDSLRELSRALSDPGNLYAAAGSGRLPMQLAELGRYPLASTAGANDVRVRAGAFQLAPGDLRVPTAQPALLDSPVLPKLQTTAEVNSQSSTQVDQPVIQAGQLPSTGSTGYRLPSVRGR